MKLKPYEAIIGIGKKPHKVLTFPGPDVPGYKSTPEIKKEENNFLGDEWIAI